MNSIMRFLLLFCVVLKMTCSTITEEQLTVDENTVTSPTAKGGLVNQYTYWPEQPATKTGEGHEHGINFESDIYYAHQNDHATFRKRAKPLKNIFMGIYRNYKSTYLGNKTSLEYKKTLHDRISEESSPEIMQKANVREELTKKKLGATETAELEPVSESNEAHSPSKLNRKRHKRKRKHRTNNNAPKSPLVKRITPSRDRDDHVEENDYNYSFGPGFNMSLDMNNDIVNVNLHSGSLKEILGGRWLNDNTEEGRGKKYEMITKVLPLFILPFLIQSAIVPFLVTKLKLLLMKSILVGKLAIFLLIISAIKNSHKMMQSYEVAPSYWAGEPSRRSELTGGASSAYNGYRVEGKPTTWIN